MRLIDADKLFEQVENLYKSAQTPERQVYSNMLNMIAESQDIKILYVVLIDITTKVDSDEEEITSSELGDVFIDINKAYNYIKKHRMKVAGDGNKYNYGIVERILGE